VPFFSPYDECVGFPFPSAQAGTCYFTPPGDAAPPSVSTLSPRVRAAPLSLEARAESSS